MMIISGQSSSKGLYFSPVKRFGKKLRYQLHRKMVHRIPFRISNDLVI
jgi:hypothetical protein